MKTGERLFWFCLGAFIASVAFWEYNEHKLGKWLVRRF